MAVSKGIDTCIGILLGILLRYLQASRMNTSKQRPSPCPEGFSLFHTQRWLRLLKRSDKS